MPFYGNGPILFEDDFTYSNGNLATVGAAKWSAGYWTGQPSLRVVSNQAAGPASSGWSDCYSKSSVSIGATGIEFILSNITPHSGASTWTYSHVLGVQGANPSGYWVRWRGSSGFFYTVGELVNGSFSNLITTTQNAVSGDSLALQILPGGVMTLWRKPSGGSWSQIGGSATDTTRTSGVVAMETFATNDRWDRVEVRSIPVPSRLKRWNGSSWTQANLKRNNGSIWVPASFKKF